MYNIHAACEQEDEAVEELELLRESSPVLAGFRPSDLQATPSYSASILSKVLLAQYHNRKVYIVSRLPGSPPSWPAASLSRRRSPSCDSPCGRS